MRFVFKCKNNSLLLLVLFKEARSPGSYLPVDHLSKEFYPGKIAVRCLGKTEHKDLEP